METEYILTAAIHSLKSGTVYKSFIIKALSLKAAKKQIIQSAKPEYPGASVGFFI